MGASPSGALGEAHAPPGVAGAPASTSRPPTRLPLAALAVACAGLFAAGVLSAGHWLDLPVPCGGSRGCASVAAHPSSRLWGVPIAYLGVAAYGVLILLTLRVAEARWARRAFLVLTAFGALASAGLLAYSQSVIGATCPWCVGSGAAMALLLVLAVPLALTPRPLRPVRPWTALALATAAALGVGVEAGRMQRDSLRPPVPAERLAGLTAADLVDPGKAVGPEDAAVTVVVFADLWCPACREAYASLTAFQRANPDRVRLAYRHLPLWEIRGHEFSGTAAALSEMAAEQGRFWEFTDAVHRLDRPLDAAGYLALMERLGFDAGAVEARMADPDDPAIARARADMDLADRLGIVATPTFVVVPGAGPPVSANPRTLPRLLGAP